MAITNGLPILAADLNTMVAMSTFLVNDRQLPGGLELFCPFPGLLPATPLNRRTLTWVAPCDLFLETLAVEAADHTAASTTTVTVTGDGELASWPTAVSGTTGAGITKLSRLLYDNTKSPSENFALTSQALRVFRKGSTITVMASVLVNAVAASSVNAILVFREFYGRE